VTDAPLYLVHHHPGYVRMRADAFVGAGEGSEILFAARRAAEAVPGLRSWSHNPKTGSVVAEYDPEKIEADDLLNAVARGAGFRGPEAEARTQRDRKEIVNAFMDGIQGLNGVISEMTDEKVDLRELVPIALVVTSVVSFVMNDNRGRLPQWANSLYHAYRIFMHWHRREVRIRVRAEREKEEGDGR